jgi:hypothetical protein
VNPPRLGLWRFAPGTAVTVLEGMPLLVMNDLPISSCDTKEGSDGG